MRTALVIGTGLIGTSAALALAGRGVTVHLVDHDPARARTAAALGAGTDEAPDGPVDLAIVAAPPAHVAGVLADAMRRGVARGYIDVASVKGGPRRELEGLGLDLSSYIGTHPMSGREKSGPLAASGPERSLPDIGCEPMYADRSSPSPSSSRRGPPLTLATSR